MLLALLKDSALNELQKMLGVKFELGTSQDASDGRYQTMFVLKYCIGRDQRVTGDNWWLEVRAPLTFP